MKNITSVRIKKIDKDGFQGREYHPNESQIGSIGKVLKVSSELFLEGGGFQWREEDESIESLINNSSYEELFDDSETFVVTYFLVILKTGELVTLIEEEIEILN